MLADSMCVVESIYDIQKDKTEKSRDGEEVAIGVTRMTVTAEVATTTRNLRHHQTLQLEVQAAVPYLGPMTLKGNIYCELSDVTVRLLRIATSH